jgi:hypothetical protein
MSPFNRLFGDVSDDPPLAGNVNAAKALSISKLIKQVTLVERSYALKLFNADLEATQHDLTVMHQHTDLRSITVELIGKDKMVFIELKWLLNNTAGGFSRVDSAGGVELPVIDQSRIGGQRFLIQQGGRQAEYQHLLKLKWSAVRAIPKAPGIVIGSEHNDKITGGRTRGEFFVGDAVRHELIVTQGGSKGYAFARDLTIKVDGVFLHGKFAPAGLHFRIGQRISAVVIQSPKGLQARAIQTVA